jgi:hypothetical protein
MYSLLKQKTPNPLEALKNELVVFNNCSVYALVGNAHNKTIQSQVQAIKGQQRMLRQALGWTVPFSRACPVMNLTRVKNPKIRSLLENPDRLSALFGAVAFLRTPYDKVAVQSIDLADCVLSAEGFVQVYSPEGNSSTESFIDEALSRGIEPVMTSANNSGDKEIVSKRAAQEFAEYHDIFLYEPASSGKQKPTKPRGSYPIVAVIEDELVLVREGCFGIDIITAILHDLPFRVDVDMRPSNYPEHVLHLAGLPSHVQALRGDALRLGILASINWA